MRARYLGDHDNLTAWGIRFPRGIFVRVDDKAAQQKIASNQHFEVENVDADEVQFVEHVREEPTQEVVKTKRVPKSK